MNVLPISNDTHYFIPGETKWVLPPFPKRYTMEIVMNGTRQYLCTRLDRPCRPSKFLLEVDAHLSPGSNLSGFIACSSQYVMLCYVNTSANTSHCSCSIFRNKQGKVVLTRHMEQPGSRQSNPAALRMSCSPSSSAWAFTNPTKSNKIK